MNEGKVLIVEDDPYWQQLLSETLENRYQVEAATTFEQAKQKIDQAAKDDCPYHVITVDMDLSGVAPSTDKMIKDGYRLVDYVSHAHPKISRVVVTGLPDISPTDVRDFFKRYQVDDFVDKSRFDLETFSEIIDRAIKSRQIGLNALHSCTEGQNIGRYEILDEIGRGGMGIVYRARDPNIDRIVALKVLKSDLTTERKLRLHFQREARSAGRLDHPNIVTIHDADEDRGIAFIVMEYLDGETLAQVLKRKEILTIPYIVEVICQVCDALDYAHQHGVIHRDIKPSNVMLMNQYPRMRIKLADFGIAHMLDATQHTRQSGLYGTVDYMSPEQVQDQPLDHRSDLYSLGVVLYEMLTGRLPFESRSPANVILGHIFEPWPISPDVSEPFISVLTRLSAKSPDARYPNARVIAEILKTGQE